MHKSEIMSNFLNVVVLVLFLDFFGFVWWSFSGQTPIDGIYIGAVTKNFISLII